MYVLIQLSQSHLFCLNGLKFDKSEWKGFFNNLLSYLGTLLWSWFLKEGGFVWRNEHKIPQSMCNSVMMGQNDARDVKDYPDSTNNDDASLFKHHHHNLQKR